MAITFSGSLQSYYASTTPVTAVPLTISCWMNKSSTSPSAFLAGILWDGGANWYGFYLFSNSGGKVTASAANNNVFAEAQSTSLYSANKWHHVCGVFSSNTSRTIYLDGGNNATNTTSLTPSNLNSLTIAASRRSGIVDGYFNGSLAEVAIWSADLTLAEVKALATGMSPQLVRPQSLSLYLPLIRSPQEEKGGIAFTTQGSPTVASHTRVYLK